jgi:hypothetical protein
LIVCGTLIGPVTAAPTYPEGAPVPRSLTPEERKHLAEHPITVPSTRGPAPGVPVRTPAEYDPMEDAEPT